MKNRLIFYLRNTNYGRYFIHREYFDVILQTVDFGLIGNGAKTVYVRHTTFQRKAMFIITPLVLASSYGWYYYSLYVAFYQPVFTHAVMMVFYITSGVLITFLGFSSSLVMGGQMFVSLACKTFELSHEELCLRFGIVNQSHFSKKLDQTKKIAMGSEKHFKSWFVGAERLARHGQTFNRDFQSLVLFLCSFYLVTTTLFSYACLTVAVSGGINAIKTSLAVSNCLYFVLYLFSFFSLCNESQKMIDAQAKTADAAIKLA